MQRWNRGVGRNDLADNGKTKERSPQVNQYGGKVQLSYSDYFSMRKITRSHVATY